MALLGLFGLLLLLSAVTIWAVVKAASWSFQAAASDQQIDSDAPRYVLAEARRVFQITVIAAVAVELWPGLASWATGLWVWVHSLL